MKQGKSLTELALELERQKENKVDYVVATSAMRMVDEGRAVTFAEKKVGITQLAHRQLGQKLNIPAKYYDTMLEKAPTLLGVNVNTWLEQQNEHRLVRTMDGNMRAFLSKGYRPLDNFDLAEAVLPLLVDKGINVDSCEITDNRFYLKAISPRITEEVVKGDVVQSGICISNSEVGLGRLRVEPLIYRLACENGMIVADYGIKKNHVGRRTVDSRDVSEFYRDETKQQDDKAFWMKVQDTVRATMDEFKFHTIVDTLRDSTKKQITGDVVQVVEKLGDKFTLADNERGSVLRHLIDFGSLTQYALANAVSRAAQELESYDRSTELEYFSSDVVRMPNREWEVINAA